MLQTKPKQELERGINVQGDIKMYNSQEGGGYREVHIVGK